MDSLRSFTITLPPVALYFMHYNFCRVHQTLRVTRRWKWVSLTIFGTMKKSSRCSMRKKHRNQQFADHTRRPQIQTDPLPKHKLRRVDMKNLFNRQFEMVLR